MANQPKSWQELLDQLSGGKANWTPSTQQSAESTRRFFKRLLIIGAIALIPIILVAYWWFHPPINIHSTDTWLFVAIFILLPVFLFFQTRSNAYARGTKKREASPKKAQLFKRLTFLPIAVVVIGLIGGLVSAVFFPGNAGRYATVLNTQDSDFSTDIYEVNYDEIPIIDRDSAALLGNRTMGSIPEYVSQFEISDIYSQINYQGKPTRVSPLVYADIIKWFNNRSEGIPAFVRVDMATQDTEIVRLEDAAIHYSQSEPLMRNIDRHVQLSYPFYLFDQKSFEIDEDGHPWWVCPVQTRTIGLFGGTTISRVILCDATTGECQDIPVEDCPSWVDRVYPAELLIEQYNWSGAYKQGWINSWLGQEGVVQTTQGYNYIAKDDDVWMYTGVTSAVSDNSIVGFVLVNQRTAESHYYAMAGATEESAMRSAEGQVQQMSYNSTFPLLLNINSQPTYFMALKDNAGLVKTYAMLDIQRYQHVAVGDTVARCQETYLELLVRNGVEMPDVSLPGLLEVTGTLERISTAVIDGNSHFYLTLEGDRHIYDCALPALIEVLNLQVGDTVTLRCQDQESTEDQGDALIILVEELKITGTSPPGAGGTGAAGAGTGAGAEADTTTPGTGTPTT